MAPPYAIIFMDSLEEDILSNSLLKPLVWWRYFHDIFMMWEHGSKVFRGSELLSSHYEVYSRIPQGKNNFFRCYCYEKG